MGFRPILFTCIAFTCIARSAFYIKAFMYNTIHLFNINGHTKMNTSSMCMLVCQKKIKCLVGKIW